MASAVLGALVLCGSASGVAYGRRWPTPPTWWVHSAHCIAVHESGDGTNPAAHGNIYGMLAGWAVVGGVGQPGSATRAEQTYRAWLLYRRYGWAPWSTRYACGL